MNVMRVPPNIPGAVFQKHLGSGGFADVFLYEEINPRRQIAVKILKMGATDEAMTEFSSEVNLLARFSSHPAIVSLYGTGATSDDRPYLLLEYCPVSNIGKQLRQQPLAVANAIDIAIRIAGAVEMLHEGGIVHHDIKPANVLLTAFSNPVLSDFGLAKDIGSIPGGKFRQGFSVPWAPPEQQIASSAAHPSADIYSLGATLYSFLAGRSPLEEPTGDNRILALGSRVQSVRPKPIRRRECPQVLEDLLQRCLAKDPADRPTTCAALANELQSIQRLINQPITQFEVQVHPLVADVATESEVTRLRGFLSIDPEATAAHIREIPQQHESDITIVGPMPTLVGPAAHVLAPADSPGVSAPYTVGPSNEEHRASNEEHRASNEEHRTAKERQFSAPSNRFEFTDPREETNKLPYYNQVQTTDIPKRTAAPTVQRTVWFRTLCFLIAVTLLTTLGVLAILFNEGVSFNNSSPISSTKVPPVTPSDPIGAIPAAVEELTGTWTAGRVYFTWSYGEQTDKVFIYEVFEDSDSATLSSGSTPRLAVDIPAQEGKTCIRVYAKSPQGRVSEAQTICVPTP